MATGKYTSKGEHSTVSRKTLNSIKRDTTDGDKVLNKMRAYLNGKNPWFTMANPNKEETKKRFIRVRAVDLFGSVKNRTGYQMKGTE